MRDTTDFETEFQMNFVAPSTPIERELVEIWQEILGVEQVGVQDNFFDLGGHSLLAMRLLSYIRKTFQCSLSLQAFFGAATIVAQAKLIERLADKEQLFPAPVLAPVSRERVLSLSFAQERLWFLDQLEPHNLAYNIPVTFLLQGPLVLIALQESIQQLINRHEALRTTFSIQKGKPVQVIAPHIYSPLPVIDLSLLPSQEQPLTMQRLVHEDAKRPFDLSRDTLIRLTLLRLARERHVLLFTVHHICFDEWSGGILQHELARVYNGYLTNTPAVLSPLPIQYVDYALWQRDWLQGERLEQLLAYWRGRLADGPALLELPTDHPRPAVQQYRGATVHFVVSAEAAHQVQELSQREGATLFMTLLSAFALLLQRSSGKADLLIGTPIAGRVRRETEGLIGFFINTLIVRLELAGDPTVSELIGRVRARCLEAYEHQELPFEKLVEGLQPERSLSYNPVFQVMFVLQNIPAEKEKFAGLKTERTVRNEEVAPVDLTLEFRETPDGALVGIFKYNIDLFEEPTIQRMVGYLQTLLKGMVAHPERRLSALPLLTAEEWRQQVVEWNQTKQEYPTERGVHELIEKQVERTEDAVAVLFEEQQVSYGELNRRANQLARYLQEQGVGPEVRVGVCLERSVELVIAVLAIWKAGGAYVPLDPAYPQERLAFMLQDAQASVLVTSSHLAEKLSGVAVNLLCIESVVWNLQQEHETLVTRRSMPGSLAYVIYTSGSTGRPKGVAICHRSVTAFIHWALQLFSTQELSKTLASTSVCFDLSVFELFAPLSCGGTVVLVENALHILHSLPSNDITLINTVPSVMIELLRSSSLPLSVRCANLAGEPLSNNLVQQLYRQETIEKVFNLYGPSECTTYSTYVLVERGDRKPSIGRPIANTQAYILDVFLQPVVVGAVGELYLGGKGVARGYLNQPALTAERFIPHAFSEELGARLYRTGDLARYLPDGSIEYLGRLDQQVKVRGFRIELEEIESWLYQHPAVQECAVVLHEDSPEERWLVAYLVWTSGVTPPSVGELRAFLQKQLPDYMLPTFFVPLPQLPLMPNGKLDRRSLPVTGQIHNQDSKAMPDLARTPLEEQLAEVWCQVLKVEQISNDDNFFDLGGHSLLATQVVTRLRERLHMDLSLRMLFEAPTIAKLAHAILQRQPASIKTQEEEPIRSRKDSAAQLLATIDQLSIDDVDALISDFTKKQGM